MFALNCTIALGHVQPGLNLMWQHNGKWLDHEVQQVDSSTVQLKLSNTSRINNGFYWCGPKLGNTSQGVNISLTVAGEIINNYIELTVLLGSSMNKLILHGPKAVI